MEYDAIVKTSLKKTEVCVVQLVTRQQIRHTVSNTMRMTKKFK